MPAKKPVVLTRCADGSVRETRPKVRKQRESKAPSLAPRKTVKVESKRWLRENTPIFGRECLTTRQWAERGDLLRIARINSYDGADTLSLADLRDACESITRCQIFNV